MFYNLSYSQFLKFLKSRYNLKYTELNKLLKEIPVKKLFSTFSINENNFLILHDDTIKEHIKKQKVNKEDL